MRTPNEPERADRGARSTYQQDRIIASVRKGILDGSWAPGTRLPTRLEMQVRFSAASVTVQRALDRLIADGFVVSRGRLGTFVVEHPPSTCHYALFIPWEPGKETVHFWTALANEARAITRRAGPRRVSVFVGANGNADSEGQRRLIRDLRLQRLAGIIFAVNPFQVMDTPVVTHPGVPRIAIMDTPIKGIAAAALDHDEFFAKALDHFQARRRTRVAVLSVHGAEGQYRKRTLDGLAARCLVTRPYWWHTIDPVNAIGARAIAHLLMNRSQHERPDALLISDDNLVEHATEGLRASGVRVPEDVDVVVHCNFPWPTPSVLPVRRLGFDARDVLDRCLQWIDATRAGAAPGQIVRVPARFEDESSP
ncbi:MAG: GntR family transcriptional regulator [Planctomycetes bacterium]|nr:GntR family transcriptional regulator [Planctomycetota bacterium]